LKANISVKNIYQVSENSVVDLSSEVVVVVVARVDVLGLLEGDAAVVMLLSML